MGGGIIDDDGEELRHRGSSWLEVDGTRLVLEDVCANHDLLEDMFSGAVKQLVPGSCRVRSRLDWLDWPVKATSCVLLCYRLGCPSTVCG